MAMKKLYISIYEMQLRLYSGRNFLTSNVFIFNIEWLKIKELNFQL